MRRRQIRPTLHAVPSKNLQICRGPPDNFAVLFCHSHPVLEPVLSPFLQEPGRTTVGAEQVEGLNLHLTERTLQIRSQGRTTLEPLLNLG
jgi:hypothetical protein